MRVSLAVLALCAPLTLAACAEVVEAPRDPGVCYSVVVTDDGRNIERLNVLAEDQPQIEFCAARLEEMRLRFLGLGGSNQEVIGAYQGQFIFIERTGVSFGKQLTGPRFFALTRTGDGRLAMPGAIQRRIDGSRAALPPPETAAPAQAPAPAN